MPRPTECTEANVAAVLAAYDAAPRYTPLVDVLGAAGVAKRTYYDWRARAEAGEPPFAAAVARVEAARRAHLAPLAATLARLAASGTKEDATRLRATTWLLDRLGGEAWNPPTKTEISGPDGGAISVTVDPAALAAKIDAIAARHRAGAAADGPGGGAGGAEPGGARGDRR